MLHPLHRACAVLLVAALVAAVLTGCARPTTTRPGTYAANRYPSWFIEMPEEPGQLYAVGYSKVTLEINDAVEAARLDARLNLARAMDVTIDCDEAFSHEQRGLRFEGRAYSDTPDSMLLSRANLAACYLDTAIVGRMVLVLAGTRDGPFDERPSRFRRNPAWTRSVPGSHRGDAALGVSDSRYREESAWGRAETAARLEAARAQEIDLREVRRTVNDVTRGALVAETEVRLVGWQVLARHFDEKAKAHYVLIGRPR